MSLHQDVVRVIKDEVERQTYRVAPGSMSSGERAEAIYAALIRAGYCVVR